VKLHIPACGDRLKLLEDWTFPLYLESRNMKFAERRSLLADDEKGKWRVLANPSDPYSWELAIRPLTLKAGSILEVDRVYIRQFSKSAASGDTDFDSITFRIVGEKHARFWAKLTDVNAIECEVESTYRQRKAAEAKP
jgi:hypothetical protein